MLMQFLRAEYITMWSNICFSGRRHQYSVGFCDKFPAFLEPFYFWFHIGPTTVPCSSYSLMGTTK